MIWAASAGYKLKICKGKRENYFLALNKSSTFILGPFSFEVIYLIWNTTLVSYLALEPDLLTNGVKWGMNLMLLPLNARWPSVQS